MSARHVPKRDTFNDVSRNATLKVEDLRNALFKENKTSTEQLNKSNLPQMPDHQRAANSSFERKKPAHHSDHDRSTLKDSGRNEH